MRSHRPNNNNNNNNRLQPAKNDHHQKKSVFDRLGHQVDSKRRQSSTPQGRFMTPSRTNQPPGPILSDDGRPRNHFMMRNDVPHNQHLSQLDRRHPSHHMDRHRQTHQLGGPAGPPGPPQQQGPGPQFSPYSGMDMPSPRHGQFFGPQHDGYGPNQPPPLHHHQQPPGPMGQSDMNFYNQHHRSGSNNNNINPGMQFRNRRMDFGGLSGPPGPPQMELGMMHGMPDEMFIPGPRNAMEMHPPGPPTGMPHDMMPPNNRERNNFMGHPQQHANPMMMPRWDHPDMMPMHHPLDQFGRPMMDHQPPGMPRPMPDGHMLMNEQQHQMSPMMGQPELHSGRYTKWRERRDVITNLDRETTQSSFRTDSLKSSLHHSAPGMSQQKSIIMNNPDNRGFPDRSAGGKQNYANDKQQQQHQPKSTRSNRRGRRRKHTLLKKDEHQQLQSQSQQQRDMSDGEIVEEESVSEDEDDQHDIDNDNESENDKQHPQQQGKKAITIEPPDQPRPAKRARQSEDNACTKDEDLDYETISDGEDLDDFMEDGKKSAGPSKNSGSKNSDPDRELLVALGLDWGSLVEMAKQNKSTTRYKVNSERSALSRFKLSEYLPKLGICKDLINPEISLMVDKICRA